MGDSGSPLVMIDRVTNEVELVGIAESGKYYCTLSPGYYTKVSKYLPWINENLSDASFKAQPVMKPNFCAPPSFYGFRS